MAELCSPGKVALLKEAVVNEHRVGLGLTLAVCAAVEAAEPAATPPSPARPRTRRRTATPAAKPAPASTAAPTRAKPLDLRIGDVRKYMMPNEFRAALGAPDAEKNTVVVEGKRELLPVEYEQPIPDVAADGRCAGALKHPIAELADFPARPQSPARTDPPDVVPPPIFRWGPCTSTGSPG